MVPRKGVEWGRGQQRPGPANLCDGVERGAEAAVGAEVLSGRGAAVAFNIGRKHGAQQARRDVHETLRGRSERLTRQGLAARNLNRGDRRGRKGVIVCKERRA